MIADATSETKDKGFEIKCFVFSHSPYKIIIILFCKPIEMRSFKLIFAFNIRKAELQK